MGRVRVSVAAPQRFTKKNPCPICGGGDNLPRGAGQRCSGFLSDDGTYAHCTREEQAGQLEPTSAEPPTFPHRLEGECRCGTTHAPAALNGHGDARKIAALYDYLDETGQSLFQVVRYSPKDFRQRRPDGNGGWVWNLADTRRILYRLPWVVGAIKLGATIYVAEGEKDVHALEGANVAATCNPGGAGKWQPEFSRTLVGATSIRVIADRDDQGRKHAETVAASLREAGIADVAILEPAAGKDAADHLAAGLTLEELVPIEQPRRSRKFLACARNSRHVDGWEFVFSVPETVPALWGEGQTVGWAKGEGLFIVGPDGVGKTTLLQQLMLGRIGLRNQLLGFPIEPAPGRVLYLSSDRPRQAASSLRRMVSAKDEAVLRERLAVWRGPIPVNLNDPRQSSSALLEWVRTEFGEIADVYIDSLKDIALDLGKDETGSRVNLALQELIADGIETVTSHHQRKELQGGGKPKRLADVYGSRWLTAGQGSVVLLWGEPGDAIIDLSHLKQPVESLGPLAVLHDHSVGLSTVHEPVDLLGALSASGTVGMTPAGAAIVLFGDPAPDRNLIERARRKLNSLVKDDVLELVKDDEGLAHYVLKEAR